MCCSGEMRGHVENMSHVVNIFIYTLHTCVEFFMLSRISCLTLFMCHKRVLRFSSHWTAFLLPSLFRFNMAHVLHVPLHTYTISHMICMALHVFLHTHATTKIQRHTFFLPTLNRSIHVPCLHQDSDNFPFYL